MFTLLGVVLGGLITQLANVYINRRKARDDHAATERTVRREAVTAFTSATHGFLGKPTDLESQAIFHAAWTHLQLTLPEHLRGPARDYYQASLNMNGALTANVNANAEFDMWLDTEAHFLEAARRSYRDLGLPKPT